MRRHRIVLAAASLGLAVLPAVPAGAAGTPSGTGSVVAVVISNFRFCADTGVECGLDQRAYTRFDGGPLNGSDNPGAWVPVHPGDTVVWTYRDTGVCDRMIGPDRANCPGHEVQFERATHRGWVGFLASRQGPLTVRWTVPETEQPGTLLRYYCDTNDHGALGLTGALIVE